ncbi:hypothetical protein C1752_01840 [Acaryochloris thomasi RCC1774]|uniref:Uncharacterized protein n=1 Tax=Acaryochloris thomasi RCC1774 TaxID=1764569 RepID=A0A2W1JKB1_9CYAN|nr:hypothetical protein [Acaryochloris thomasi]PZD73850.1 hypothetical protein C1752_01840 [Acaryochloris thomasi RCC1774]
MQIHDMSDDRTAASGLQVLWMTWLISTLLLLGVGGTLFFAPGIAQGYWPWSLAPFNTRLLGAVYLSAAIPLISYLIRPRMDNLQLVLPIFTCFTTYFLLVSMGYRSSFLARKSSSIWFFLYGADSAVGLFYCWRLRHYLLHSGGLVRFVKLYQFQAIFLSLSGLGLLLAPLLGMQFWMWPLDSFHSHLYSGVFLGGALGMGLLGAHSTHVGRIALGVTQAFLGVAIASGNWLVDQQVNKLAWNTIWPWFWQFAFLVFGALGGYLAIQELRAPKPLKPEP